MRVRGHWLLGIEKRRNDRDISTLKNNRMVEQMKKPKLKKRGGVWIVYRNKKHMFKCFSEYGARVCYGALMIEYQNKKRA
jgi:hypothetical protein